MTKYHRRITKTITLFFRLIISLITRLIFTLDLTYAQDDQDGTDNDLSVIRKAYSYKNNHESLIIGSGSVLNTFLPDGLKNEIFPVKIFEINICFSVKNHLIPHKTLNPLTLK